MERQEIEAILYRELKPERFRHTMGVMYTAANLAAVHGVDMEKALLSGLLHDCAKGIPEDALQRLCREKQIPISDAERKCPFLLHAKYGAYLAKETYGIQDLEILHAIEVHTTGAPGMGLLAQILFIADYMEPNRKEAPNLPEVRKLAWQSLTDTMCLILRDTLSYLKKSGGEIDPMTQETYKHFMAADVRSLYPKK